MIPAAPIEKRIVLVGAGHSHVEVLRTFAMQPEPGVGLTIVAKEIEAAYSGMLPGWIAGHYGRDDCHIDAGLLARSANARLVHGEVIGIDRASKRLHLRDRPSLHYDVASFDIGITPDLSGIEGADAHAIAVKPVSTFGQRWLELSARALAANGPRRFVMVGAGAAGFELILALRYRLVQEAPRAGIDAREFQFTLIGSGNLLATLNHGARSSARRALASNGVSLIEGDGVVRITDASVTLASGRQLASDATLVTTAAAAPAWLSRTDLVRDDRGFISVRPTLQAADDDDVFAAGDCATVIGHPREKAGVFAVRQGPWLSDNLRRRVRGEPTRPHLPQRHYLTLLSLGDKSAIAARGSFWATGAWVWRWKDHIDRKFMMRYDPMAAAAFKAMSEASEADLRCGGCAAKVGPLVLQSALDRLEQEGAPSSSDRPASPVLREDAAIIDEGGDTLRLETVDFFRAFWSEPHVFGEIAAEHAANDIYAMGGTPTRALAVAVLPYAGARQSEDDLYQLMTGAKAAFERAGIALVGGHTSEGAELSVGFHISGTVARERLMRKGGLRQGDVLVLTKPLGTGIVFAGAMCGLARSRDVVAALAGMRMSNREAARVLVEQGANALTDVTGFGLAGHLLEMLEASGASAAIEMARCRRYPGVDELVADGVRSTLLPANLSLAGRVGGKSASEDALAVLFDPQTSGGLLAGVSADRADLVLRELAGVGVDAMVIGNVTTPSTGARIRLEIS